MIKERENTNDGQTETIRMGQTSFEMIKNNDRSTNLSFLREK